MENVPQTIRRRVERMERANPDAIVSLLDIEGVFLYMSPSISMLGYTPEDTVGHVFSEFYQPADVAHLRLAVEDAMMAGESVKTSRAVRLKSGGSRNMRGILYRLTDKNTGTQYLLNVSRPVD
jgi:PAS domain S-box-containing protein